MRTLYFLLRKEFRQIFRNPTILRIILVMPIMQLLVLPQAANFEVKNINICVIDHDHSTASHQLLQSVTSSGYFTLVATPATHTDAMRYIENDKTDIILEIPQNFDKNIVREPTTPGEVFLAVNAINGVKATLGSAYLSTILRNYNTRYREQWIQPQRFTPAPRIEISTIYAFNTFLSYKKYMVPGILALLITMVAAYLSALNIVKEKELGTIEQINVTPIKKHIFILGKLIPFWIIGLIVLTIGLTIMRFVYGIVPTGSIPMIYAFAMLYIFAILGLGLLISTLADTQQQAMFVAFFFMMIFIMLGGLFTLIDSMPYWAQTFTRLNPVRYFIEIMRMVILKGSNFSDMQFHFLTMAGFGIVLNSVAVLNYRKRG